MVGGWHRILFAIRSAASQAFPGQARIESQPTWVLSNSMYSAPLSFQSLTSRDYEGDPQRIEVTATLSLHPKDQAKLKLIASRLSMEKSVSSVNWREGEVLEALQAKKPVQRMVFIHSSCGPERRGRWHRIATAGRQKQKNPALCWA
jgi:hypothetical protein